MSTEQKRFGVMPDGTEITMVTLENQAGMRLDAITYGCRAVNLLVPGRDGKMGDVMMGFGSLEEYLATTQYQGATVGRYANRIGGASFPLDGVSYRLPANEGKNQLHGGNGFAGRVWKLAELQDGESPRAVFSYHSADGEEGFPGALDVTVTYTVTKDNVWEISYEAVCDKKTVVNLTNHSFFNLCGYPCGNVLAHELTVHASRYTPTDAELIPTGEVLPVAGTPLDFTAGKAIGRDIHGTGARVEKIGGYDHNFVLDHAPGVLSLAAEVYEPASGRTMEVWTDLPGVQLYTANKGDPALPGKGGCKLEPYYALCLETQFFPDSPNKPDFPSTVLAPGQTFRSVTRYCFGVK